MEETKSDFSNGIYVFVGLATLGTAGLLAFRYKVCNPDQILVRTGLGIKDMSVTKKGLHWPFQNSSFVSLSPMTFGFDLHNMSSEKVEFKLPIVFTIAPINPSDDLEGFKKYANYMINMGQEETEIAIGGIIEGETRGLTSQLTVEEMFNAKDKFRSDVVEQINQDLNGIGLRVINANIKEMSDYNDDNKYFEFRKQRAIETANYEAQVDVAEAKRLGEIGIADKEGKIRMAKANIERDAKLEENLRDENIARSNANLAKTRSEAKQIEMIADIEAHNNSKIREEEMKKKVFEMKKQAQIEQRRSEYLVETQVEAESKIVDAEGKANALKVMADAELYRISKEADAELYRRNNDSDALLYNKQKEAEGELNMYEARAEGTRKLFEACGNDVDTVKFMIGLQYGLYDLYGKVAEENAKAVQNLNPKFHIWNTGASTENPMNPILNTVQSLAPMIEGLEGKLDFKKVFRGTDDSTPKEIQKTPQVNKELVKKFFGDL